MLDIGTGIGALLVSLERHPGCDEMWVRDEAGRRVAHTGVHARGSNWYALFAELEAGTYYVETGECRLRRVRVHGGSVTEVVAETEERQRASSAGPD